MGLERPRTKARALERVLALMKQHLERKPAHVSIMHANVPEDAESFRKRAEAELNCAEPYVTDFTPAIGVHTGAGTLAMAFYHD